jgi:homoserine dehydrogenase
MFPTASAVIEDLVFVCQNVSSIERGSNSAAVIIDRQPDQLNEYWLVQGLSKNYLNPAITVIDQAADGIVMIKAAKNDVEQLSKQSKSLSYFPILVDFETAREESLTAL